MQLELAQYEDALQFSPEHQLTAEPLRIDLVIIRKVLEGARKQKALGIAPTAISVGFGLSPQEIEAL
jgi:hypothetical protein